MSYEHHETCTFGCDRCGAAVDTETDALPDKWILTDLFADSVFFHLCGQCVANLARWFEPPDTKGVKATKSRTRRAKAK